MRERDPDSGYAGSVSGAFAAAPAAHPLSISDILYLVLHLLNSSAEHHPSTDLLAATLVCRQWNSEASRLLYSRFTTALRVNAQSAVWSQTRLKEFTWTLDRARRGKATHAYGEMVRDVVVGNGSVNTNSGEKDLRKVIACCPNMIRLELINVRVGAKCLASMVANMPALRELVLDTFRLSGDSINKDSALACIGRCHELVELSLTYSGVSCPVFLDILRGLPGLRKLDFGIMQIDSATVRGIVELCPNLEDLQINSMDSPPFDDGLVHLLRHCPRLKRVRVLFAVLGKALMEELLSRLQPGASLYIRHPHSVSRQEWGEITPSLDYDADANELTITIDRLLNLWPVLELAAKRWPNLRQLHTLAIMDSPYVFGGHAHSHGSPFPLWVHEELISWMGRELQNLHVLRLFIRRPIPKDVILNSLHELHRLEEAQVNFSDYTQTETLTATDAENLRSSCDNLREIEWRQGTRSEGDLYTWLPQVL